MNKRIMDTQKVERSILHYTNKERRKRKLKPVVGRRALIKAARAHSRWMGRKGRFSHRGEGGSLPWDRAREWGYPSASVGENIWQTSGRSGLAYKSKFYWRSDWKLGKAAVITWMNSPGHRENLLRSEWTHLGVGVYRNKRGRIYLTQNFGSIGSADLQGAATERRSDTSKVPSWGKSARAVAGFLLLIALLAVFSGICN